MRHLLSHRLSRQHDYVLLDSRRVFLLVACICSHTERVYVRLCVGMYLNVSVCVCVCVCVCPLQARDINLDIKRVVAYRYWCNKLYNAIRYAQLNLPEGYVPPVDPTAVDVKPLPHACRWLLSRLSGACAAVNKVGLSTHTCVYGCCLGWCLGRVRLSECKALISRACVYCQVFTVYGERIMVGWLALVCQGRAGLCQPLLSSGAHSHACLRALPIESSQCVSYRTQGVCRHTSLQMPACVFVCVTCSTWRLTSSPRRVSVCTRSGSTICVTCSSS